jgi:predicted Rossmann-fold nucleotide-binding protein
MKYKIGIFGSSAGDMDVVMPKAMELGKVFAAYADQVILVTGACAGLPYAVISEAASSGIEIWGFSSALDEAAHHKDYPDDDHSIYTKIMYVPADFPFHDNDRARKKYRNVISTATCDAGIIISGRWGSLNEFTNLIDQQKLVGLLTGTGGVADELPELSKKITKAGQGEILCDEDPSRLVEKLLTTLEHPKDLEKADP